MEGFSRSWTGKSRQYEPAGRIIGTKCQSQKSQGSAKDGTVRGLDEPSEDGPRVLTLQGRQSWKEKLFGPITQASQVREACKAPSFRKVATPLTGYCHVTAWCLCLFAFCVCCFLFLFLVLLLLLFSLCFVSCFLMNVTVL